MSEDLWIDEDGDCTACGGSGEVEAKVWIDGFQTTDSLGCPHCMSREFAVERANHRATIAERDAEIARLSVERGTLRAEVAEYQAYFAEHVMAPTAEYSAIWSFLGEHGLRDEMMLRLEKLRDRAALTDRTETGGGA